ncbi:MAG TPA: hypothetical protein VFL42_11885, partial [Terriglobales bacterium]|nr:hypothetical protein [Terriglobales bacterium]
RAVTLVALYLLGLGLPATMAADKKQPVAKTLEQKQDVLRQARAAYYNLRSEGLLEFQANVVPDWNPILEPLRKSADAQSIERAKRILGGLHFAMSLDRSNTVKVTHSSDAPPENADLAKGFNQIFEGMEQALTGFFETWSPFMLTSMFPDVDSEFQLDDLGDKYKVSYKDGDADVVLTMGKNFVLSEAKVTSPKFSSFIWPEFTATSKGLVLSGYSADYRSTNSDEITKLKIKIGNREINALQLPGTVTLDAIYNGNPYLMQLAFADFQVQKK